MNTSVFKCPKCNKSIEYYSNSVVHCTCGNVFDSKPVNRPKIYVSNLIIEVTRQCNMRCQHCLRGEQENRVFLPVILDRLLKQDVTIGTVTLSGGEPSMHPEIIRDLLKVMKKYQDSVNSFYIATNNKDISPEFVIGCLEWYLFSEEREMCRVDISNDYHHTIEMGVEDSLLSGLSFIGKKYENNQKIYLLAEGNAKDEEGARKVLPEFEYEIYEDNIDIRSALYLNVNGILIKGCDFSYESQKDPNNILCQVSLFRETIENLKENDNV